MTSKEISVYEVARLALANHHWREMISEILDLSDAEMDKIQATCPSHLKAKFYRTDSFYEFPTTGSRLFLIGVNEDLAEGTRGRFAHEIITDELGSYREANYIINEVFKPMLFTTKGELCEMGTPPDDLAHIFYDRKKLAIAQDRFIGKNFDEISTEVISQSEKDRFIEGMGGRTSPAVRRELYLEPVSDPTKLIIPEFSEILHVVDTIKRPVSFTPYVGIDLGFNDFTAFLFGYYDFLEATVVIEDELLLNGKNSLEIVTQARAKEVALWGKDLPVVQRWSDNDQQQLYDMLTLHKYAAYPTRKDDKMAAINAIRQRFQQGKIKIHARCKNFIFQLKTGLWADSKKSFIRSPTLGHVDLIDAAVYLNRNINETLNPFNPLAGKDYATHYIPNELLQTSMGKGTPTAEELKIGNLFGG